jgi:protease-4
MSSWPPNPDSPQQPTPIQSAQNQPTGKEWFLLEKTLMASIEEQRRARRWNIFFKGVWFVALLIFFSILVKSCGNEESIGASASPHLAVVDITGEIGEGKSANSDDIIRALEAAFKASQSKAVVLNINSPGGSPVESDEIWQEMRRLKTTYPDKKLYAVIGDMGASGAYYIASAADEIYVNPSSLVGSIGVIMPNYGVEELAKKLGVQDRTMTAGAHKAMLSMTKPLDPFEKAHVQSVLDNVHQHFIAAVKTGRGKRLKIDDNTFSGLFWSGEQAINLGLADKVGYVGSLKRELKLKDTVDYSVEHSSIDKLMGRLGTTMGQGLGSSLKLSFADLSSKSDVAMK